MSKNSMYEGAHRGGFPHSNIYIYTNVLNVQKIKFGCVESIATSEDSAAILYLVPRSFEAPLFVPPGIVIYDLPAPRNV